MNVLRSQLARREFGGSVCELAQGRFFATEPETQGDSESEVWPTICPQSIPQVAGYHTHVGPAPQDTPSDVDRDNYRINQLVGYVGVSADLDWTKDDPVFISHELVDCKPQNKGNIWEFAMEPTEPGVLVDRFRNIIDCADIY